MSCMLIPWSSKGDVWVVRLLSDASIAEGGTFWIHSLNRLSIRLHYNRGRVIVPVLEGGGEMVLSGLRTCD